MDAVQTAIKDKIIVVQGRQVILDSDVAALYGVETKRVNEAIKNNPDKFPDGYILQLTPSEWEDLRSKISTTKSAKVRYAPKAFTEKGLYMLATILKSPVATQTTIGIIETFAKVKELSRTMSALQEPNDPHLQERLAEKGSRIISDLLDDAFETTQSGNDNRVQPCRAESKAYNHPQTEIANTQTNSRPAISGRLFSLYSGLFRI